MADVPPEVAYGQVVGHFVRFIADTTDAGDVPDELPLSGKVTLSPLTTSMRFASTTPPRLAVADNVECTVSPLGDLAAPGGGAVFIIATAQPAAEPSMCQWRATFAFEGVKTQPTPVVFDVPTNGVVDISQAISVPPEPPVITVVSTESEAAAAASASEAASSASEAASSASEAAAHAATWNQGVIVLSAAAPIPPGTPAGTIVLRTAT